MLAPLAMSFSIFLPQTNFWAPGSSTPADFFLRCSEISLAWNATASAFHKWICNHADALLLHTVCTCARRFAAAKA